MKQFLVIIVIALLVSCIQCHSKIEDIKKKVSKYAYRTQHCSREHSKFVREYFARVKLFHMNKLAGVELKYFEILGIAANISTIIITCTRKMSFFACL
jgi:hypothetical protein